MASFLQKTLLFIFTTTTFFLKAQVKFTASVSSPQICKNEFVQLRFTVENAKEVQQISPPLFKNFIVVSGPNQESSMTMINGNVNQYISVNFVLKPKSPGNFTIEPATAEADGRKVKSNAVKISVSNTLADNNTGGSNFNSPFPGINPFSDAVAETPFRDNILRKGENAEEKINKNMFIKLELDKTSCYVGEPVIATYKLYTRLKSESNLIKNPSFNGFSVIDLQLPGQLNYTREKINGREFNVYVIRKAQLYPLQPGNLELEPTEIDNQVSFIKEEYASRQNNLLSDVFSEFEAATIPAEGIENRNATLRSKTAVITVKALPEIKVPENFKGAVGNFAIEAMLEKNNFTADDAGNLKVIISGTGNLQLVNTPEIDWPKGFEAFEPTTSDDFIKTTVPVSGRKIIDYSFTISAPGNYVTPSIKFSYFNPKEGRYKTDSARPVAFTVTKGTGVKAKPAAEIKIDNNSFLNKFFSNRRWVVSTVAVLILSGLIFWIKKDTKKKKINTQLQIKQEAVKAEEQKIADTIKDDQKNWLANTEKVLHADSVVFYNELNLDLKNYLSKKLNLPVATINKKNIFEELDKSDIDINTSVKLQQVLNDIELQLYTPFAEREKMQEMFKKTEEIIELLDTYKFKLQ